MVPLDCVIVAHVVNIIHLTAKTLAAQFLRDLMLTPLARSRTTIVQPAHIALKGRVHFRLALRVNTRARSHNPHALPAQRDIIVPQPSLLTPSAPLEPTALLALRHIQAAPQANTCQSQVPVNVRRALAAIIPWMAQ